MSKSKYYLPVNAVTQSYQNEKKLSRQLMKKNFDVYDDAIILPIRRIPNADGELVNAGGVCDKSFNFLAGFLDSEYSKGKVTREVAFSYKTNDITNSQEDVIFSGILINHFGHFLTDSMVRMWYAAKNSDQKIALLLTPPPSFDDWNFEDSYHIKMLELMGIEKDRIIIVDKPTQFKSVTIPKQSIFWLGKTYDAELINIVYDNARQAVKSKDEKRIYLSRTKWNKSVINESYFEDFFSKRGFKVLHPQEMPLDEQISYIAGADEIVCIYGTLSHLALFAKQGTKLINLMKQTLSIAGRQQKVDILRQLDSVYIDVSFNFLPNDHGSSKTHIVAPTIYWEGFLSNEYGIESNTDIFEFLNKPNIIGDFFKLYLKNLLSPSFHMFAYAFKFNPYAHLKSFYDSLDPDNSGKMLKAAIRTDNSLFKGKLFTYRRSDTNEKYRVKLLSDGRIWPINPDRLKGEAKWSYFKGRLYFLNGINQIISEFVTDVSAPKRGYAKYCGVIQSKVTDTCSLETYQPVFLRNWAIKHTIKLLVSKKKYKKLKHSPGKFFRDSKSNLIRFLGRYYIRGNSTVIFYWRKQFQEYFNANNMKQKIDELKYDLDEISKTYIDNFMKLSKHWFTSTSIGNQRPEHELQKHKAYREFKKTFKQPFPEILNINPYYFFDNYGLADLPKEALAYIDGKVIIDGGGLNGDTALAFHHHFPNSEIHVYEPLEHYVNIINRFLREDNCNYKIKPVNKGLGEEIARQFMRFGAGANMAEITTIDTEYTDASSKIGLIKLDTEGMETQIIKGAEVVIGRDKPVLAIAIYHRPEDFFELKNKIKALNPAYRFMIRKSEPSLPQADLVLIAY